MSVASVLESDDLLSHIFYYAISNAKEVPFISLTSRQWDDVLNKNPQTGHTLWRNICAAQEPELIRIFDLCQESTLCRDIPDGGWKTLLYRSQTSCYKPWGANQQLQKNLEMVFKPEGIMAYSNCCSNCTESYANCSAFKHRAKGIVFFKFYLNGTNYEEGPRRDAAVSYNDIEYLHENWDTECDIIRRWCAVLGVSTYTVEKPTNEDTCIIIRFDEPVTLEECDPEYDDDEVSESDYDPEIDLDWDPVLTSSQMWH